jgi:hypothetical protein
MLSRVIPPHPEERQRQGKFEENGGVGKSAQSLCGRGSWNGGIIVAEAAAVTGELMEGGDVVTMIMMTWNVGDPTGITAGTVLDMMMMRNDAKRR